LGLRGPDAPIEKEQKSSLFEKSPNVQK